jgi:predicted DNA-binding transcriptional regulator YafY
MYEDRMRAQTTRAADPYGLVSKAGVWYLVAKTCEGFRSFRVDRIRELRELDERYDRDGSFDLDAHWRETTMKLYESQGRYPVVVRVDAESMPMVMSYWPTEPVSEDDPQTLRVMFSSEDSAVSALVSWGDSILLLEPDALRPRIIELARKLLARYEEAPAIV